MTETDDTEVACTVEADQDPVERESQARRELLPRYEGFDEHDDGYTFEFTADEGAVEGVAEFVDRERVCCSFAEYHLSLAPPYEVLRLTVTGPDGTKQMFSELVDSLETGEAPEHSGS